MNLKIRKPDWCDTMSVNAKHISNEGYYELSGTFKDKEEIVFEWPISLKVHRLNEKVAFTYGPCVLAFDSAKSDRDIKAPVWVSDDPEYRLLDTENEELVRVICDTADGEILLTDYQSCGKNWLQEKNLITVWLD